MADAADPSRPARADAPGRVDARVGRDDRDPRITVVVIEDHQAIATSLAAFLDGEPDLHVVALASTAESAAAVLGQVPPPAVALCDVMLDGTATGFDLLREYGARTHFVMYTAHDLPAHHARALALGAAGFISKLESAEAIVAAIRRVGGGGRAFSREVLQSGRRARPQPTPRELELLSRLAEGASNAVLAERLGITVKTVESLLRRMFDRYGCANRTQLVRLAFDEGWIAR